MKKSKVLFYIVVFAAAVIAGMIFEKNPTYPCEFEQSVIIEEQVKTERVKAQMPESGILNINTATAAELTALSGIGEKTSEKIVDYRNKYGRFETCEDILKVPGIGEKTFLKIKENISVK